MKTIKVFTAFSGYESQMMGLERLKEVYQELSFELVGWCEIDENAIASHNAVYPQYANRHYPDISEIDWSKVPEFDLFVYSSCCQDISRAGNQKGVKEGSGTRSALLWYCLKGIKIKKPKYCLLENVASFTDFKFVEDLQDWEDCVNDCGYNSYIKTLIAANYNVPQNRDRVFMVSIREDIEQEFYFPKRVELTKKAVDLLEETPDSKYYYAEEDVLKFLCVMCGKNIPDGYETTRKMETQTVNGKILSQIITPTYGGGIIPTLLAGGGDGASWQNGLGKRTMPIVLELWESSEHKYVDYKAIIAAAKVRKEDGRYTGLKKSAPAIKDALDGLKSNQFFRLRKMTPVEYLRFQDVSEDDIYRLTKPRETLEIEGYDEKEIGKLLSVEIENKQGKLVRKAIRNTDADLWKQAGNSIAVGVLTALFKELFRPVASEQN